jgi:DNA invertase Pin-like site-specific DNA recombinase
MIMGQQAIPVSERFTDEQKNQVKIWFEEGKTQDEIGKMLGVPRRTVGKLFSCLDLYRDQKQAQKSKFDPEFLERVKKLREQGKTIHEIARATERGISSVHRVLTKFNIARPGLCIDVEQLIKDYGSGMNLSELAAKCRTSTYTISKIMHENNVELRDSLFPFTGRKQKKRIVEFKPFEDSKGWFAYAYIDLKCSMSEIANFLGRSIGYVSGKLSKYDIEVRSISEGVRELDYDQILVSYKTLGSMSKVASRFNCTVDAVKRILLKNDVVPTSTSDMFVGDGNPFYGRKHDEETRRRCAEVGAVFGRRFWAEHPEFAEVVRKKQKELWSDLERRRQDSLLISRLRREGRITPKRGRIWTRFGELIHDSSYELGLIEFCIGDRRVVHLERDFDLVEYEYDGVRYFVPDFRVWLSNGDFLIVETKSEWLAKMPKEREKIMAGFSMYRDKFMVLEDDFGELGKRIDLALDPLEFNFDDVELRLITDTDEYLDFYAVYHYMGRTGRRGWTVGGYLGNLLIGAVTVSSVTRAEMAERHGLSQSEVRELVRFCIHPDYHKKNFASWLLARVVVKFRCDYSQVRLLVSFADTTQGHVGTIYKASNWVEDGMTGASYHYVSGNGDVIHKKTVYDRAKATSLKERQYAMKMGLVKQYELPKARFYLKV